MAELTEKQRVAIDRLQSQQENISEEERRQFMQGIIAVPKSELSESESKKKAKRTPKAKKRSS